MNFFYQGENIKFTNLSWTKKISRTKNKIVVLLGIQYHFFFYQGTNIKFGYLLEIKNIF